MPDVAWTSDVHGRTRYVSPKVEALLGFTNQELYAGGTHLWLNQIHPEDFGRVSQRYMALFEQQVAFDEEYRIRRKDGTLDLGARSCDAHTRRRRRALRRRVYERYHAAQASGGGTPVEDGFFGSASELDDRRFAGRGPQRAEADGERAFHGTVEHTRRS